MNDEFQHRYHTQECGDTWFSADGGEADVIQLWDDYYLMAVVRYTPVPDDPEACGTYTIVSHDMEADAFTADNLTGWQHWQDALEFATGTNRDEWDKD